MSDTQGYIEAYQELKGTKQRPVITRAQWKPPAGSGAFFVAGSAMAGRISDEVCAGLSPVDSPPETAATMPCCSLALAWARCEQVCAPPAGGVQLAADAVIDMLCLAHCDVFLATGHSMFCMYPAKLAVLRGSVVAQLPRSNWRTEHEGGISFNHLLYEDGNEGSGKGISEEARSSSQPAGRRVRSPAHRR